MRYRATALTPLLVGDGNKLAPIDYMVWKDQVNVLDQDRIFRLLARGPRLEGYLTQLRRAEKLDFASWGGFAQNYAARRIPFEHATMTGYWNDTRAEHLFIPTFARDTRGPYLPASALKGALRTGYAFSRWNAGVVREIGSRMEGERGLRRPGEAAEAMALGSSSADAMRIIGAGDSDPVPLSSFKVYLMRIARLDARGPGKFELGWKQSPRGAAPGARPEQSTPAFAEMAVPGTVFTGDLKINEFLRDPEISRALRRRENVSIERVFQAANDHARALLEAQRRYADEAGLPRLTASLNALEELLGEAAGRSGACILNMGFGGGFLSKSAYLDTADEDFRKLLARLPYYERSIRSGLPFPKTRRMVFEQNQPSTLPGWVLLEVT
jgi:CRISPR-associated protein Csm5